VVRGADESRTTSEDPMTTNATITDRDINALAARELARGRRGRLTVALVARARGEETPEHAAILAEHGWTDANAKACLAEVEELVRRAR
jgi:hypothetical protein